MRRRRLSASGAHAEEGAEAGVSLPVGAVGCLPGAVDGAENCSRPVGAAS